MFCYDKKFEVVCEDFIFEVEGEGLMEGNKLQIIEVDCVFMLGEILDLLQIRNVVFGELEEVFLDRVLINVDEWEYLYGVLGGLGGYVECIF